MFNLEENEIVKECKDFPGYYVSNFGNVYCNNLCNRYNKQRKLKPQIKRSGYCYIGLWKDKKKYHKTIHRLVYDTFYGLKDNELIDHVDENKTNNRLDNLQILTSKQNRIKSIDKSKTTSKYIGVCYVKNCNKWLARKGTNKNRIIVGYFDTEEEAYDALKNELKQTERESYII